MKKIFCLLLAVLMALALSACGSTISADNIDSFVELFPTADLTFDMVRENYAAERKTMAETYSSFNLNNGYTMDFKLKTSVVNADGSYTVYTPWTFDGDDNYVKDYPVGKYDDRKNFDNALIYTTENGDVLGDAIRSVEYDETFSFTMTVPSDYTEDTALAGATVQFEITPVAVYPAIYDDDTIMASVANIIGDAGMSYEEGDTVKMGDLLIITFVGKIDGEAFEGGSSENFIMHLGHANFIDGFETAVAGHKVGETFTFPITFPEDYGSETVAGKNAEFTVTISLGYDFADATISEKLGFDTAWDLENEVRTQFHAMLCLSDLMIEKSEMIKYPTSALKEYTKEYRSQGEEDINYYYENYFSSQGKTLKETETLLYGEEGLDGYAEKMAKELLKKDIVSAKILIDYGVPFSDSDYNDYLDYLVELIGNNYGTVYTEEQIIEAYGEAMIYINGKCRFANKYLYSYMQALPFDIPYIQM